LEHWPWSPARKRRFAESRVGPGEALTRAIQSARSKPRVFIQFSGINHYGLRGDEVADESTPAGSDFLAQLTVQWEASSRGVEQAGVRWIAVRNAIVLDARRGLLPTMVLPLRLFVGGRLGSGRQPVPWIHVRDHAAAVRFLLENAESRGVYNLVAPAATSSEAFLRAAARTLGRPYWLPVPAFAIRLLLGERSSFIIKGRYSAPRRLLDDGFRFAFADIDSALADLFGNRQS